MPKDWNVKRPLRVLSLFDGIGTGKLVLDLLGFEVEAYFASEVNPDCLRLTEVRHPAIKQLGDVTMLTAEKLVEIAPIDLVIGGSPCQDFSIVNPLRKGLMGRVSVVIPWLYHGLLFFDFYRILNELQSLQQANRPLFFLYENVASMNKETKAVMTRFFKRQPNVWDAINFTAQRRKRYFWGNIPGLKGGECVDDEDVTELKEVLMPGRKARMSKVRCVTSRSNSLRQSKHNHKQFPVAMGNHLDTLWIPELERLFGFPQHYTDVANIPVSRRQVLLGNSWSVPVVKRLLLPLKNFFQTKH
ncbi:hypothetical protein CAPTEDRAFT_1762 [Capitella teleta]|uniref:DNA (cytosine-5-)-methyltransferase n=1 Tax=Capitella teleta TaxID=283909 RepID=R7V0L6_CAPTE|nr:hypothetical protein CAPTEDRAFT_1762 [Capitella teleta]|eukprot:ELU12047.1 hypothetical protein CAPTEDRAFT_1762 [Capitella teleta]